MKKNELKELEKLPFEKALERLETVVGKMEEGDLPLEQMIKYFEEGSSLSKVCAKKLKELEKKIEILVKETPEGGEWEDLATEDDEETDTETSNGEAKEESLF